MCGRQIGKEIYKEKKAADTIERAGETDTLTEADLLVSKGIITKASPTKRKRLL